VKPRVQIDDLDLPAGMKDVLRKEGYETLYPPQEDAIKKGALEGKSLVLASPTASGKTLVAEFCALKHILERNGKVLYLAPLRALASEKYFDFRRYTKLKKPNGSPVKITVSSGDYDKSDPYLGRYDLIVATNEKADSLLRHRTPWMEEISLVIADEIHLIQDANRGPTLEVTLARLKQINPTVQILALSATVANADEVADWLDADYVVTEWRPVPLREGVLLHDRIQFKDGGSSNVLRSHPNQAVNLAVETVRKKGQALIFAETRKVAVNLAQKASEPVGKLLTRSEKRILKSLAGEILSLGERTQLSEVLAKQVENGVSTHHAGIHHAHRRLTEENFRKGLIKVIAATPTLAAGVNLPARVVILHSHTRYESGYGRMEIPVLEYKQMAGRAGRPHYDQVGEASLIANSPDEQDYLMENYICANPERIWSKLAVGRTLRTHVLAAVASGFARSEQGLQEFFGSTFYAMQYGTSVIQQPVFAALRYLIENNMVKYRGTALLATAFGKRVSELYIDPETAVLMRKGFQKGVENLTPLSFLQLIAHTPDISPKLYPYRREMDDLQLFLEEHRDELIFEPPDHYYDTVEYEVFLAELKCVGVLERWIEETKENVLLEQFRVEPGDLYRLVERSEWLLYAAYVLAKLFKHADLLNPLRELRTRTKYGVKHELLNLIAMEGVGRVRARALFNSGIRKMEDLKRLSLSKLMAIPGIGQSVAVRIKEQAGGTMKKRELQGEIMKTGVQEELEKYYNDAK